MKKIFALAPIVTLAIGSTLASCSDDSKDEPQLPEHDGTTETVAEVNVDRVFTNGYPLTVDGGKLTLDSQRRLSDINLRDKTYKFDYSSAIFNGTRYDLTMTVNDTDDNDTDIYYIKLNAQGYAHFVLCYDLEDNTFDQLTFAYNGDGHLTTVTNSADNDAYHITYSDGNIDTVDHYDHAGNHCIYSFVYTNADITTPIANKGKIMLYDEVYHVDVDDLEAAYFAGILGQATDNLPMGFDRTKHLSTSNPTDTQLYHWTLNINDYPSIFWKGNYGFDAVTFTW